MASPAYVWITDDQGQLIKSSCQVSGREHSIEAFQFDYAVSMPVDRFTGATTGTRQHETVRMTKAFCPASPALFEAACRGKTMQRVEVKWYHIDANGREQEYFTHILEDVKVVSYHQVLRHVKDSQHDRHDHEDEVEFRFGKIAIKHHDGNIEASDTWTERT